MNLQFYLEKLENSDAYKKFKKENSDSFLCSCFFSIDKEGNDNKQHLDFFVPSKNKMFSFQLESEIKLVPAETAEKNFKFKKISGNSKLEFEEIEKIILDEMEKQNIKSKIQKILIILQNKDKKDFWICTVFISGFGLLRTHIDDSEKKITLFEKKSFMDILSISGKKRE